MRPLFFQGELESPYLTAEESRHAIRVLRLKSGDSIELTDGRGQLCQAEITSEESHAAGFRIVNRQQAPRRSYSIHLVVAPTKNLDRMEWMVEKCTEIGVEKISFVECKTSERPSISIERLHKITVVAMKQSRQAWLPELVDMVPLKTFLSTVKEEQRFIAHVDETNPVHLATLARPGGSYALLVGPEGDFTSEELALAIGQGYVRVSLGANRLRTETAGVFGVAALNLVNQKSS